MVTMNKLAVKKLQEALEKEADSDLAIRIVLDHVHDDHGHYSIHLDKQSENDEVLDVQGLRVLLDREQMEWLDGLEVKYLLYPREGFKVTHPNQGHGHHE